MQTVTLTFENSINAQRLETFTRWREIYHPLRLCLYTLLREVTKETKAIEASCKYGEGGWEVFLIVINLSYNKDDVYCIGA